MVICLVQGAGALHGPADATTFQIIFVSLKFEIQNGLPYLMLEYPNSAEKRTTNEYACVCQVQLGADLEHLL